MGFGAGRVRTEVGNPLFRISHQYVVDRLKADDAALGGIEGTLTEVESFFDQGSGDSQVEGVFYDSKD